MKKLNIILLVMCLFSVRLFAQQSVNMPGTDGQEKTQAVTSDLLLLRRRRRCRSDTDGTTSNGYYFYPSHREDDSNRI